MSKYAEPKVTIDLAEYNYLKKQIKTYEATIEQMERWFIDHKILPPKKIEINEFLTT